MQLCFIIEPGRVITTDMEEHETIADVKAKILYNEGTEIKEVIMEGFVLSDRSTFDEVLRLMMAFLFAAQAEHVAEVVTARDTWMRTRSKSRDRSRSRRSSDGRARRYQEQEQRPEQ